MTKLVEKNDKVKSFSALLVENLSRTIPIRFLNQLRKAQVLQNCLKIVYQSFLLSNWNCYLWETITAYNYGFAQDLPEKGKPCAKPLTVIYQSFRIENTRTISNISTSIFRKHFTPIFALNSKNYNCFVLNLCVFNLLSKMVEFENIGENSLWISIVNKC